MSDMIVIGYPKLQEDFLVDLETRPSSGVTRRAGCTSRPRSITQ